MLARRQHHAGPHQRRAKRCNPAALCRVRLGIPLNPSRSLSITQCIHVGCHTHDLRHTSNYSNVTCRNVTHQTHTHSRTHSRTQMYTNITLVVIFLFHLTQFYYY
jgi:hypothetical protein